MAFLLQYNHQFRINSTPGITPGTMLTIARGITSIDPDNNEDISQDYYYDGNGAATSDVIGIQKVISFEGHRDYSDPAQNFIMGLSNKTGPDRVTNFEWELPDGTIISGPCTVANIKDPGGDANSKGEIEFEIHFNGQVLETPPVVTP